MQLMLASPAAVVTAQETHLFSLLEPLFRAWGPLEGDTPRQGNKNSPETRKIGLSLLFGEEEYFALIRQFSDRVWARILDKKPAATVILEKTPQHVFNWRDILHIYPDAYFLHLVRDPRAVVSSILAAQSKWSTGWAPFLVDACRMWLKSVGEGREIAKRTKNYREIRYEDLLTNGQETLRSTFAWMGVELTAAECQEVLDRHTIDKLRSGAVGDAPWNVGEEPQGFFRKGGAEEWKSELSRHQVLFIEAMTRREMLIFGYQAVSKGGLTPASAILRLEIMLKRIHSVLYWQARRLAEDIRRREFTLSDLLR